MTDLPKSAARFLSAAKDAKLNIEIRQMADSTRTAEEAAQACGCIVAQIVKSLVFRGAASGKPYLLLVSGKNRVDQKGFAKLVGEKLDRPAADYVRDVTGYSIGGIPPLGHAQHMETYMDMDLLGYDVVFAAAGTPNCIFAVAPHDLATASIANIAAFTTPSDPA